MIIGTAGHIDHGKSVLVEALTGRRMDRLADERRRGITIELNFAPLELDGIVAGVVDVPGHEDFIRTMVAGASGIDLVLLVVAADEGLMPQSVEHLAIVEQLGLTAGIPVITKSDLVDPEWAELVAGEVADRVAASRVSFQPPIIVSARRGDGMAELRSVITALAKRVRPRLAADGFRLPIDRVFSLAGVGTVVTGTAWSGTVSAGDKVRILPGGVDGRVRSVQMYGRNAARSEPGARVAIGIAGVDRQQISRGDVLVTDELPWVVVTAVDTSLELLGSASRAIKPHTRVRVHLGTAELLARVHPRSAIEPGKKGLARLSLESRVAVRGGDRFVLRSYSPLETVGGGVIVDPCPPRRAPWPPSLGSSASHEVLLAHVARRAAGVSDEMLALLLGITSTEAKMLAEREPSVRSVQGRWVTRESVDAAARAALAIATSYQRDHPSEPGISQETLRQSLRYPAWVTSAALEELAGQRRLELREGIARTPGFRPTVPGGDDEVGRIVRLLEQAGLAPPSVAELEALVGRRDVEAILRIAAARGLAEAVERERFWAVSALNGFVTSLRAIGAGHDITPARLREALGLSRKYLIPLLEWADSRGITIRVGDVRRLKK